MNGARFFLDTNIFLYAFDETRPEHARRAQALIESGLKTGLGVVSYQVMQEFCNVALKVIRPLRAPDLDAYLDHTFARLELAAASLPLLHRALRLNERNRVSWYNALILAAAQAANCRILYSEDLQHGQQFDQVRVENPFL